MDFKSRIRNVLHNPLILIDFVASKQLLNWLPDKPFLKLLFYSKRKERLNLKNPISFNHKIQWLKLYDRNKDYIKMVDKLEVRKYITKKIGSEHLIPLIGVYKNFNCINFDSLPQQFVLKCTHDSGGLVICKNKENFDKKIAKKKIKKSLKRNFYFTSREWPYKYVEPKIICEEFIEQENGAELRDYRFFCFNGEPKFITVDFSITDKKNTRRNLYDLDWNLMNEEISYPKELDYKVEKPDKLQEMIDLSKKLSSGIPHLRVDFYYINNNIIFGELTFFHQSGMGEIKPSDFNEIMGDWIKLPI
ncbi:ATP-grasp fold amidoligase family protein [Oceanobacillus kimchii]|uniref:ATP-grasp fold amidoligase family protein n=1 Tax=Oceanobacillus kimchii TaxID=746691 RepID=UPI003B021DCF